MDRDKPLSKDAFANWAEARNDAPGRLRWAAGPGPQQGTEGEVFDRPLSRR